LEAKISEGEGKRFADVVVRLLRQANPTRFRDALQAGGDIDAVAQEITASDHYIANMDADAEAEGTFWGSVSIQVSECLLDLDGTLDGINGGREFSQQSITCRVGDPAPMLRNEPVHDLAISGKGS
jgi:hypothetical protein